MLLLIMRDVKMPVGPKVRQSIVFIRIRLLISNLNR